MSEAAQVVVVTGGLLAVMVVVLVLGYWLFHARAWVRHEAGAAGYLRDCLVWSSGVAPFMAVLIANLAAGDWLGRQHLPFSPNVVAVPVVVLIAWLTWKLPPMQRASRRLAAADLSAKDARNLIVDEFS